MRTRFLIASILVLLGLAVVASPANAKDRPPGGDAFVDEDGNPTIEVTDGQGGEGGGGGSADDSCQWKVVIADDFATRVYDVNGSAQYSTTGRWLQKVCDRVGAVQVDGRFLIPEGGAVDVEALAQQARASVGIEGPSIRTSPEVGKLYVQIPTWLWIDAGWWHGYQATASTGRVTATVTARPLRADWALGDGGQVSCAGPGVTWQPGMSEDATNCSHNYTTSSAGQPGGTFALSATVVLDITWTSNVGDGGTLAPISRSSSRTVEVGEIQAVGTGG